jgi:hypothetical protein
MSAYKYYLRSRSNKNKETIYLNEEKKEEEENKEQNIKIQDEEESNEEESKEQNIKIQDEEESNKEIIYFNNKEPKISIWNYFDNFFKLLITYYNWTLCVIDDNTIIDDIEEQQKLIFNY